MPTKIEMTVDQILKSAREKGTVALRAPSGSVVVSRVKAPCDGEAKHAAVVEYQVGTEAQILITGKRGEVIETINGLISKANR